MKKWIIVIAIIGGVIWAVSDFVMSNNDQKEVTHEEDAEITSSQTESGAGTEVGLEEGNQAPDFELETIDGETVRLSELRGEKILLNFWATWCPPCRAEMPDMQKYHEEEHEGIILAVNLVETEQGLQQVDDFLQEYGITFRILMDENTEVSSLYSAFALPTSYLINREGIIHTKAIGTINYDYLVEQFESMD